MLQSPQLDIQLQTHILPVLHNFVQTLSNTLRHLRLQSPITMKQLLQLNIRSLSPLVHHQTNLLFDLPLIHKTQPKYNQNNSFQQKRDILAYQPCIKYSKAEFTYSKQVENQIRNQIYKTSNAQWSQKHRYCPGIQHDGYKNRNLKYGLHPQALSMSKSLQHQLCQWIGKRSIKYGGVTKLEVRQKAKKLFGKKQFQASGSWLRNFVRRNPKVKKHIKLLWSTKQQQLLVQDIVSEESEIWDVQDANIMHETATKIQKNGSNCSLLSKFQESTYTCKNYRNKNEQN